MKTLTAFISSFLALSALAQEVPLKVVKLSCNDHSSSSTSKVRFKLFVGQATTSQDVNEAIIYKLENDQLVIDHRFDVEQSIRRLDASNNEYHFKAKDFDLKIKIFKYPIGFIIADLSGQYSNGKALPAKIRCTVNRAVLNKKVEANL